MNIENTMHVPFLHDLLKVLPNLQVTYCSFKNGEIIFEEGTTTESVYFVANGEVKTYKHQGKKLEQQISLYRNTNCFGYLPVIQKSAHQFSAIAYGDVDILKIDKNSFLYLLSKSPEFAKFIFENLSSELTSYLNRLRFIRSGMIN
jgi:CRP/FNR family transcriptional regulator, anaerobic regulatory protein